MALAVSGLVMTRRSYLLVMVAGALASGGCLGSFSLAQPDGGTDVVSAFNAIIAPILTNSCASCHGREGGIGPAFLQPKPDMLTTLLAYPGLIGLTPETSRIYAKGVHEGPALTADQAPIVAAWINRFNAGKSQGDGGVMRRMLTPIHPTAGTNVFDLSQLDPSLAGAQVTFTGRPVGGSIELSAITVVTTTKDGLHIVHPLWVIWDEHYNPSPDGADSFSNLDETVPPSQTMPLGPGLVILTNWKPSFAVSLVFGALEAKAVAGAGDGGTVVGSGCKNLAAFVQYAKPTLAGTCANCHANAASPASTAFPLTMLNTAGGDAQACQNALAEINPTTPAMSRIYTYTDPASGVSHPFKFPAKSSFADMWIVSER